MVDAQPPSDSNLIKVDSFAINGNNPVDTIQQLPVKDSIKPVLKYPFTSDSFLFQKRLFFSFINPVRYTISEKQWQGKEIVFYSIIALLLFFAGIKNAFNRYLSDLFTTYFRTTMRQKQVKEQLLQNPLSSLFFNIFFVISATVYLSLLFQHFRLGSNYSFAVLAAFIAIGLTIIYGSKFLFLKFFGWVFQITEATETYIFIVFSTNKILGVCLLPFTILLAFTYNALNAAALNMSLIVVAVLFVYRYFLSYISINRIVHLHFFQFILYLAAFEILPLLLINKLLFGFLSEIS